MGLSENRIINSSALMEEWDWDKNSAIGLNPHTIFLGLKNKQNDTYYMSNGAEMRISSGSVTFIFPAGLPHVFFDNCILAQSISLELQLAERIKLQITYNDVCEPTYGESVAELGSNS